MLTALRHLLAVLLLPVVVTVVVPRWLLTRFALVDSRWDAAPARVWLMRVLGAAVLAGQALWTGSWILALWLVTFVLINVVYFLLFEEPGLERRFGEPYREYKQRVPRWIPRRPTLREESR